MFKTKFSSTDVQFNSGISTPTTLRGEDGFSPIVSIQKTDAGHEVEITDVNGTKVFEIIDGIIGKDGYTPQKGLDYYTPEEKEELINQIEMEVTGDIDEALEVIIAIQNELMSGFITFSVDGKNYNAEQNMTWEEWIKSTYSTSEFFIDSLGQVSYYEPGQDTRYVRYSYDEWVPGNATILSEHQYFLM